MTNFYEKVNYSLWPVFREVDAATTNTIVLLHIFGNKGGSAIFVTKDDDVYAIGENVLGFLGIGDLERTYTPIRLDLLCGKYVLGFASGSTHSIAYTKDGDLFSWGDNSLGKLGNGTIISRDTPGRVILPQGVKVMLADCSDRYTAAITVDFKILHWGDVEWNYGTPQTMPSYIEFPEGVVFHSVCCGAFHAAALSSDGKVFTWGRGESGQLGQHSRIDVETRPRLVQGNLDGICIKDIACTLLATVTLTSDGRIFAWGFNRDAALSLNAYTEIVLSPKLVQLVNEPKITAIAASGMGNIITASSETTFYEWGLKENTRFMEISSLEEITCSLNAFAQSPTPRLNRLDWQNVELNDKKYPSLSEMDEPLPRDIGNVLFNNKEYSDLTIRLSDGVIYVHKLILRTFCDHFKSMLDGSWAENSEKEIDLTRYNAEAYRAFVKYIYTGKIDCALNGQQLIELCDIAESYVESNLKEMVIAKFPSSLTVDNVAELYSIAHSQPCEEIKELCCQFVSSKLEEVILTKGFDHLKGDLCKSLVTRAVQIKKSKQPIWYPIFQDTE